MKDYMNRTLEHGIGNFLAASSLGAGVYETALALNNVPTGIEHDLLTYAPTILYAVFGGIIGAITTPKERYTHAADRFQRGLAGIGLGTVLGLGTKMLGNAYAGKIAEISQ